MRISKLMRSTETTNKQHEKQNSSSEHRGALLCGGLFSHKPLEISFFSPRLADA
jgi:hypothetical protein